MPETTSAEMTWSDPPPRRTTSYDWPTVAGQLRMNPMEWLKVFDKDRTSIVVAIRNGGITALAPDKGFEVRTANNKRDKPRTCSLWVRYNPDKDRSN